MWNVPFDMLRTGNVERGRKPANKAKNSSCKSGKSILSQRRKEELNLGGRHSNYEFGKKLFTEEDAEGRKGKPEFRGKGEFL